MSTSLITHLRPGVLGSGLPSASKFAGAWFHKQPATIDGVVVDERRGLGTDRAPLPRRALTLNGTNQYVTMTVDTIEAFPFTLFGFTKDPTTGVFFGLSKLSDTGINFSVLANSTSQLFIRRSVGGSSIDTVVNTSLTGWRSWVFVFDSGTSVTVYKDGALVSNLTGLTDLSISSTNFLNQFNVGVRRITSPSNYGNGSRSHCGFHRGAATLENAINLHKTGELTGTEEINLPLDNNSTTVSYNIGRSASWWMNEPRRNLFSYPNDITSSYWSKTGLSPSSATSATVTSGISVSTLFAGLYTASTAARLASTLTTVLNIPYTYQAEIKATGLTHLQLRSSTAADLSINTAYAIIKLSDASVANTNATVETELLPDGWVRVKMTHTPAAGNRYFGLWAWNETSITTAGTETIQIRKQQLEPETATDFQPVTGTGIEYPEATLVNAPTSYVGRDVPFSSQNTIGYSTRRNLLSNSGGFTTASWSKVNVTATENKSVGPSGGLTADLLSITVNSGYVRQLVATTNSTKYTASAFVKNYSVGVGSTFRFYFNNNMVSPNTAQVNLSIDINAGTIVGSSSGSGISGVSTGIDDVGNGWYRVWATFTLGASAGNASSEVGFDAPTATRTFFADCVQLEVGELTEAQTIGANPGTTVLFPALLDDPTKSAARDTLEFQGEAHFNAQLEDANCFTFDGVDDYVAMDLGDVAGPELVTNGDFASGTTGWTNGSNGTGSIVSGKMRVTNTAASEGRVYQTVTGLTVGRVYRITVDAYVGSANVSVGFTQNADTTGGVFSSASSTGTLTLIASATATTMYLRLVANTSTSGFYAEYDNVSVKLLPTITHDGTSTITYRSQGNGFTGTAGTAFNIRFGDVEHIPCCEGQGSILHGTLLEQEYSVVNGQANNWETFQDEYFYDVVYGFNLVSGVKIPASQVNPSLDVLGHPLSNPPRIGLNNSGATINHSIVEDSWPDTYSIPGADLSNYEFDGDPGDIEIRRNRTNDEGKFVLEK